MNYIFNKFFTSIVFLSICLFAFSSNKTITKAQDVKKEYTLHSFHVNMYEKEAEKICKAMKPSYSWLKDSEKGFHSSICVTDMPKRKVNTLRHLTKQPAFIVFDIQGKQVRNFLAVYFEPQEWIAQHNILKGMFPNLQIRYTKSGKPNSITLTHYNANDKSRIEAYVIDPEPGGHYYNIDRRHNYFINERIYVIKVSQEKNYR